MAIDDDFVFTISDNDDLSDVSENSGIEAAATKIPTNKKRKRQLDDIKSNSKPETKKIKTKPSIGLEPPHSKDADISSDEDTKRIQDDAIDPDFTFDAIPDNIATIVEDFDGWDLEGRVKTNNDPKQGKKKSVDVGDIISRRLITKLAKTHQVEKDLLSNPEIDVVSNESESRDSNEENEFPNFEDDELLALDGFGAGAASEDDENQEANINEGDTESSNHSISDSGSVTSNNEDEDSVASPTAHPDDLVSDDDDSVSTPPSVDAEELAKRAAFFSEEHNYQPEIHSTHSSGSDSFHSFSLSRPLLRGLGSVNFTSPTPIQKRTIPIALAGKDVVGSAVTGSGKTAAFLLPILERLLYRPRKVPTTRVAILLPTRELAVQCYNVSIQLAQYTDITFAQLVGGFSLREQEATLKKRPDVVIATPGRFIDHMRNSASFVVENLEILVLDEADRMLEDGFADELDEILRTIPKGRQTMLFSATMTESVDKLIRVGMNKPVRVSVDASRATVQGLIQEFIRLRPGREGKRLASLSILCTEIYIDRVIIFFRQKKEVHRARIVFGLLGINAGELHGGMSQDQRINAVSAFKAGKITHLLATDLASRGLDIKNVLTVINYEAPQTHEIYLHRVGRTARAGKSGQACTIAAEPDRKIVRAAVRIGRAQGANIVSRVLDVEKVDEMDTKLQGFEEEIEEILKEEQEEKQLAQAEMQLTKGENIVKHESEIMSKPKRTWFETEKDKRAAKKIGRAELNGPELVNTKKEKRKLSGKDKKRLDDRRERMEGKMWRKGKESENMARSDKMRSKKGRTPKNRVESRMRKDSGAKK